MVFSIARLSSIRVSRTILKLYPPSDLSDSLQRAFLFLPGYAQKTLVISRPKYWLRGQMVPSFFVSCRGTDFMGGMKGDSGGTT
jgi:hypothetical protein